MLFVTQTGPGMRQVVGFADLSTEKGTFGSAFRHAIVSNGDFTAYVCDSASTVWAAVWGGRAVGRGITVLDGAQRSLTERGGFRGFCSPLSQWEMPLRR